MSARIATPAAVRMVICYTRTANPGTVGQRHLHRQHAKLHAACAAQGWTVVAWIEDLHQSGTTLTRPGLQHALVLLADHHADALLATEQRSLAVDQATGSQLEALAHEQGWQLLTLTTIGRSAPVPTATVVHASRGPSRGGTRR
jgi:DNA invertase Pin-like site-specific DNA recombinase